MEGNASVYHVYPVSGLTGEGKAEFLMAWGAGFRQEGVAGGGDGKGSSICARGNSISFNGTHLRVVAGMHQFIMNIL